MTESRVEDAIRDQGRMEADRANFETLWESVAQRVIPHANDFRSETLPGQRKDELQHDATASLALENFAAAVESITAPRSQKWHGLRSANDNINDQPDVRRYNDAVRDQLFRVRYDPNANFAGQYNETLMGLGAFGTAVIFTEDDAARKGISYSAIHLAEAFMCEGANGRIDKFHRKYRYTARQAKQKFGDELPDTIKNCVEKEPERPFEFLHCVKPNEEYRESRRGPKGMRFVSYHIAIDGKKLLREGGYRTMPYAVARYVTGPREVYGRSPAILALSAIKTLNAAMRDLIQQSNMAVRPPLLLPDDDVIRAFQLRPGALNWGGVDDQGRQLVHPLNSGSDFTVGFEVMQQLRETINRAFLVSLFTILVESPQMTATEALIRAQEKGALLAPTMGRLQSELLLPIIEREIDILAHAGALPPMPDVMREAGGEITIAYETPLTRAQRAEEAVALARTLEGISPLANINPAVLRRLNADESLKMLAEVNGLPNKLLYSDEEMKAIEQQAQQQQMMEQLAQAAPLVASTTKDFAQAGKYAADARVAA